VSITFKIAELLDLLVFYSPKPPYWIEIKTNNPTYVYYFGHFDSPLAAKLMEKDYIDDLIDESAIVVSVKIKQCQPEELTIDETDKTVKSN
jgi:hypothetical protein